jgi:hypothetical protein
MSENEPAAVASTSELCKKGDPIPVDTESESELTDDEERAVCVKGAHHKFYGFMSI